ncbi:Aldo-keto reductase family 4 member C9 [Zostera marina]|uniref:Aldo-keto reductase family 4 member C9 n=1 Tax=Zostera marina TaxID=29655 RepID=A0A0K9NKG0_ZOSMR|nr:Aldo-keto reductase family 4 member C9 [Zostera marina]
MESFTLNTGAKIPSLGFGTWQSKPGEVATAVVAAVKAGYKHIDCAKIYENQEEIGAALKKLFEEGVVKREDLFITSKLWSADHGSEDVPEAFNETLKALQIDYLDLYLIHWPVRLRKGSTEWTSEDAIPADIPATWSAMEKLFDSGKARAIGISNFSCKKIFNLLATARIVPAVNQVECHPGWQQKKLQDLCEAKGIHLTGYSPLGSPGTPWMKGSILADPTVVSVAEELGKSPAQVCLRWGIQAGHSVIPKSVTEARIKQNLDIFNWSIPDNLFAKFGEIEQIRLLKGDFCVAENQINKSIDQLWDGEI